MRLEVGMIEPTTVEDMDLAVRASMCRWKLVYLHDLEVNKL
jgi:beta-mannan synthase